MSRYVSKHAKTGRTGRPYRTYKGKGKRRDRSVVTIGASLVSLIALAFLVLPLLGIKTYVITGGSMTGVIGRGALVFEKSVPVEGLTVGDIITYTPPQGSGFVTHRIISVQRQADGTPVFKTRGDFNESADPWMFTLDHDEQPRYVAHIPYLGYLMAALGLRLVRALLIGACALALLIALALRVWPRPGRPAQPRVPAAATPGGERWPGSAYQSQAGRGRIDYRRTDAGRSRGRQ